MRNILTGMWLTAAILVTAVSCAPSRSADDIYHYTARTVSIVDDTGTVWRCLEVYGNGYNNYLFNCQSAGKVIEPQ